MVWILASHTLLSLLHMSIQSKMGPRSTRRHPKWITRVSDVLLHTLTVQNCITAFFWSRVSPDCSQGVALHSSLNSIMYSLKLHIHTHLVRDLMKLGLHLCHFGYRFFFQLCSLFHFCGYVMLSTLLFNASSLTDVFWYKVNTNILLCAFCHVSIHMSLLQTFLSLTFYFFSIHAPDQLTRPKVTNLDLYIFLTQVTSCSLCHTGMMAINVMVVHYGSFAGFLYGPNLFGLYTG